MYRSTQLFAGKAQLRACSRFNIDKVSSGPFPLAIFLLHYSSAPDTLLRSYLLFTVTDEMDAPSIRRQSAKLLK